MKVVILGNRNFNIKPRPVAGFFVIALPTLTHIRGVFCYWDDG